METAKIISLYKGSVEIKFNPGNHSYYLTSEKPQKRLCGVTTHIGVLDKPALIPWAVGLTVDYIKDHIELIKSGDVDAYQILRMAKEEANKQRDVAAEIGTAIHAWIEAHIKDESPDIPDDPRVLQGVNNFLEWVEKTTATFLWSERVVYSKKYGYVGTADFGVKINGKKYLADIKTGNGIYAEVKQQTAAYLEAVHEEDGKETYKGRWVLRISKETEEDYKIRMQKKVDAGRLTSIPPFKVFEAIFLDNDPESMDRDFQAYLASKLEYEWKKIAEKELKELR